MAVPTLYLSLPILSFLSGVAAHFLLWIRGEWDGRIGSIVFYTCLLHHVIAASLWLNGFNFALAYVYSLAFEAIHLLGTFTSIFIYRVCFHPLRKYPGPFWARIWIWYIFVRTWNSKDRHSIIMDELHAEYGDIVRYGPNRLSVNSAAAVPLIHGTGSTSHLTKSVVYLNPVNGGSINADRNEASHHARRKIWEKALATKTLPTYIQPVAELTERLVARLRNLNGQSTIANRHVQLFTFDTMGTIGFGRQGGFDGLTHGHLHPAIHDLIEMMRIGVYMMLVPWLHCLLDYVPTMGIIYKPDELFRVFAADTLGEYCDVKQRKPPAGNDEEKLPLIEASTAHRPFKDILNQIHPNPSLSDRRTLSDCVLLAIAGADTTTSAVVHALYRLAYHPDMQSKIHSELLSAQNSMLLTGTGNGRDLMTLSIIPKLPYLEAFINEVLRLHPPAPTGLPRLVPKGGVTLPATGEFVPEGTNISIPIYTLLRSPQNFVEPESFIPERFLPPSHPDSCSTMVTDRRAFIPFLQGPYGCAGKALALMELKLVLAGLVRAFDIKLPAGVEREKVHRKVSEGWKDYSTVKAADVELRFVPRGLDKGGLEGNEDLLASVVG